MIKHANRSDVGWVDAGVQADRLLVADMDFQSTRVLLLAYGLLQQSLSIQGASFAMRSFTSEADVCQTRLNTVLINMCFFAFASM